MAEEKKQSNAGGMVDAFSTLQNLNVPALMTLLPGVMKQSGMQTAGQAGVPQQSAYGWLTQGQEQQEKPIQDRLPQEPNAPQSKSYSPGDTPPEKKSPTLGGQLFGEGTAPPPAASPTSGSPPGQKQQAVPSPSSSATQQGVPDWQRFLFQTGLNLMVGYPGNAISNIGQAAGGALENMSRAEIQEQKQEEQAQNLSFKKRQLDINQQTADASTTRAKASVMSARNRRLGKQSVEEEAVAGMSPEAKAFFTARMKGFNKSLEPSSLDPSAPPRDANEAYQEILNQTRLVDFQSRASRGELKAEEVDPKSIKAVVDNPALEQQLMDSVKADPLQTRLLRQKIEKARGQGDGGAS